MTETYYVLFCESDRWFAHFLKADFSHVLIYKKIADNAFIQLNPAWTMKTNVFKDITRNFQDLKDTLGMQILKVTIDDSNMPHKFFAFMPWAWGIYNCVILAKYTLGIRSWCLTPYQLYKFLVKGKFKNNKNILNVEVM